VPLTFAAESETTSAALVADMQPLFPRRRMRTNTGKKMVAWLHRGCMEFLVAFGKWRKSLVFRVPAMQPKRPPEATFWQLSI
jgi:hypothetical protein